MVSPNRNAHHDANSTMSCRRSGIAAVSAASTSTVAGLILWTRVALAAPTMRAGLAATSSSLTADAIIVRSNE